VLFSHYHVDGTAVTAFEPVRGRERFGTQPDRFAEMRQVGLWTDVEDDDDFADPVTGLLEMLTVALGIWLPRDVALGPLLTVQRHYGSRRAGPSQRGWRARRSSRQPHTLGWEVPPPKEAEWPRLSAG
jgi:hypothetical protein